MNSLVNVSGIYNLEILNTVIQSGVDELTFDLRPSSFNFVQEYVLLELLEHISLRNKKINLHFEGEADFVIEKIVKDTRQVMATLGELNLIFSDKNSFDYYEQFNIPYSIVVKDDQLDPKINESKLFREMILPNETIGLFGIAKMMKMIGAFKNFDPERKIVLEVDYNHEKIIGTSEGLPADKYIFTIGSALEIGYRQVDSNRIKSHLSSIKF